MQHFPCGRAAFVEELGAYGEQLGKGKLNDAIEISSVISALESIYSADCQQAMKTCEDLIGVA